MTKTDLFSAWLAKCEAIASSLSLPLAFCGIDTETNSAYVAQAGTPYLSVNIIWGEESRPYLDGHDGQLCNSIVQIDCIYPREQEFKSLSAAQSVKSMIFLDSNIGGIVYNVAISPPMRGESTVMYSVSVTIKQIDII